MGRFPTLALVAMLLWGAVAWPQNSGSTTADDTFRVYTEHPRLFLRPQRLRLLKREKERQSIRWQQFEALVAGRAPMPEPGFAYALYYQVSGDAAVGRKAVAWATGNSSDLRQLALVFDWCHDLLTPQQSRALAARIQRSIDSAERDKSVAAVRSRTLGALAIAGQVQDSAHVLENTVRTWWEGGIAPALKAGHRVIDREDAFALFEILHALRDNLNLELRDATPGFFKDFPREHLMSHYPATYPAPDGEYRIPVMPRGTEPDLRVAALSRAAEFSMVAYDANAPESQVLQGWLLNDHFLMRGPFGITYEFLWANPYQPGLSYYHVPLIFRDEHFGRLYIRSSWDESATWLASFDGVTQLFAEGKVTVLNPQLSAAPISLTEALVVFGAAAEKFRIRLGDEEQVFVLGLKPKQKYDVEVDDEEMRELITDAGGILELTLPRKQEVGVRMHETPRRADAVTGRRGETR
jgi:hypothetical protein